ALRVTTAVGLVFVAAWPALWYDATAALVCVLLATGVLAVVLIGDYAWVVGLSLGAAALVVDSPPARHMTAVLTAVPLGLGGGILVAVMVAYWWWGPREVG